MKALYSNDNRLLNIVNEEVITLPSEDLRDESLAK
jgi:hypothetical protein